MSEKQKDNLIPFNKMTVERQREIASLGGKRSQEVRKQKKTMRETLQMIMDLKVSNPHYQEVMKDYKIKSKDQTNQTALMMNLYERALNSKTLDELNEILEILGQKPTTQDVSVSVDTQTRETTNAFLTSVKERPNGFDENE